MASPVQIAAIHRLKVSVLRYTCRSSLRSWASQTRPDLPFALTILRPFAYARFSQRRISTPDPEEPFGLRCHDRR